MRIAIHSHTCKIYWKLYIHTKLFLKDKPPMIFAETISQKLDVFGTILEFELKLRILSWFLPNMMKFWPWIFQIITYVFLLFSRRQCGWWNRSTHMSRNCRTVTRSCCLIRSTKLQVRYLIQTISITRFIYIDFYGQIFFLFNRFWPPFSFPIGIIGHKF